MVGYPMLLGALAESDEKRPVNTTQPEVRDAYNTWITQLISNYTIDGLRIDSVKNVEPDFWGQFQQAAGIYAVGEVADTSADYVCSFQSELDGVLNYAMYYAATDFFSNTGATTSAFEGTASNVNSSCRDPSLLGTFSENHDQPRFASYTSDLSLAKNILAFTLLTDGIPIIYAGQEQHYNGNASDDREATWLSGYSTSAPLVPFVTSLNKVRRAAINSASSGAYATARSDWFYSDDHTLGISKGQPGSNIVLAVSNLGESSGQVQIDLGTAHGYAQGTTLVEILSCSNVEVGNNGDLKIALAGGVPQVLFPQGKLSGSGLCGM